MKQSRPHKLYDINRDNHLPPSLQASKTELQAEIKREGPKDVTYSLVEYSDYAEKVYKIETNFASNEADGRDKEAMRRGKSSDPAALFLSRSRQYS